jgi:hypothetical protein
MPIDGFDPASVEHGELKARVSSLEADLAETKIELDIVKDRQRVVLERLAAQQGARGLMLILASGFSVLIGIIINMADVIRHWLVQL